METEIVMEDLENEDSIYDGGSLLSQQHSNKVRIVHF
jgi:hypothetical protein